MRPLHKTQQECEKKNLEYKLAMERERERDEEERQRSLMLAVPQDWRKPTFPKLSFVKLSELGNTINTVLGAACQ